MAGNIALTVIATLCSFMILSLAVQRVLRKRVTYVHLKTGRKYQLHYITNTICNDDLNWPVMAVYSHIDTGEVFSRPHSEFVEKFEKVK